MVGTLLVAVAALVIAVVGLALLDPVRKPRPRPQRSEQPTADDALSER